MWLIVFAENFKLVAINFIIADCLDILFSLLNVSRFAVKRDKNRAAHGLVP